MSGLEFHPLADIFPLIEGGEFDALVADIAANGLSDPIVLHEDKILDGRNRYRACLVAGVQHRIVPYRGKDALGFVISKNLHRRHLDESQRAMVAARLATLKQGARTDLSPIGEMSQGRAAELLNVGKRSVERAAEVREHGAPELQQAVERGSVSVSAAADVAGLPKEEQTEIVARGEREILEAAKSIRLARAEARRRELAAVAFNAASVPEGKFETIVIDPPWPMTKIDRAVDTAPDQVGASLDYPTMTEEQLRNFGATVTEMAADDCHLFMWTTQRFLPLALNLVETYGFRYVLTMVWHKPGGFQPYGLPAFNCEFVIYARRGAPRFVETKAFSCCFAAQRREHSRKPSEFYDVVSRVTAGQRIDVFSREERDGFAQYGNEIGKFAKRAGAA